MSGYKTSAELKREAKNMLRGRWGDAVWMNLIPTLIMLGVMVIAVVIILTFVEVGGGPGAGPGAGRMDDGGGGGGNGGIGGLFTTLIHTGISFAFLDAYRHHQYTFRPFKDAFQVFSKKYFLPVLFIYLLSTLFTFLWALLFIIPGIIKSYAYSQAYFIYKDHIDRPEPEHISALDCITESKLLMKGHKMRYFMLQLSFIGWILVGLLTLGIGFLWISPYMLAANTAFYNDLVNGPFATSQEHWSTESESPEDEWEDMDF